MKILYSFITILIFNACTSSDREQEAPTYVYPPDSKDELWNDFKNISPPTLPGGNALIQWEYSPGKPEEGLKVEKPVSFANEEIIHLPHRVLLPDHPLWYRQDILLTEPVVLKLNADDGAQVFVNEKQILRFQPGELFLLPATRDSAKLVVRVLNNAMAGGLREAKLLPERELKKWMEDMKLYVRKRLLVEKVTSFKNSTVRMREAIKAALSEGTEASVSNAEKLFEDYPYFLIRPYLYAFENEKWRVALASESRQPAVLYFGSSPGRLKDSVLGALSKEIIQFDLPDLQDGKEYTYRIRQGETLSDIYSLRLPPKNGTISFTAWGDSQNGIDSFMKITTLPEFRNADFTLGAGDLVSDGSSPGQWTDFFKALTPVASNMPLMLIAGNHDHDGYYDDLHALNFEKYFQYHPSPNYFLRTVYNAVFIALNPNETFPIGIRSTQKEWFFRALQSPEWQSATWRFLVLHQPPYSQGWDGYSGDAFIKELVDSLAEKAGIDYVISGHTHDYERLTRQYGAQQTTFVITGGAGGSLEEEPSSPEPMMDRVIKKHHFVKFQIEGDTLRFRVYDTSGRILDEFYQDKSSI